MGSSKAIGIDLGTTFSCVAVFRNGTVEIIPNDQGNRTTPSMVAFDGQSRMVGEAAAAYGNSNPKGLLFDSKRFIGRKYSDEVVQKLINYLPFAVERGENDDILLVAKYVNEKTQKEESKSFTPIQISAFILGKLAEDAAAYIGEEVTDAVITVPAYFNDQQRRATIDAAKIAGLNVLRLVNEPTAAAMAYNLDKESDKTVTVMVVDFGGGTFDVSLVEIEGGVYLVKGTKGDTDLGGRKVDLCLENLGVEEAKRKFGDEIKDLAKVRSRIRSVVERAKRTLSSAFSTNIYIDNLCAGKDFSWTLTRAMLNRSSEHLFQTIIKLVEECLIDTKTDKSEVQIALMVGGSTRIPRVVELVEEFFQKPATKSINADEAVAYGAAMQAAILSGVQDKSIDQVLLLDVTSMSYGLQTAGGVFTKLIPANTTIPTSKTSTFTTYEDNQTSVVLMVYQGERAMAADNFLLGSFSLDGIVSAPRGVPKIDVTFEIDHDGILKITAVDTGTGKSNNLTISNDNRNCTPEQMEMMKKQAEQYKEEDKRKLELVEKKNEVETFVYTTKKSLAESKSKITTDEADRIRQLCEGILDLLAKPDALLSVELLDKHYQELKTVADAAFSKLYQGGAAGGAPGAGGCAGAGGYPGAGGNFGNMGATSQPPPQSSSGPTVEEVD